MCYFIILITTISLLLLIIIPLYYKRNVICGIFNVDYNYGPTVNIGDYIQSIAAMQHCKGNEIVYVERDSLSKYKGKKIKVVMNAWWRITKNNMIPSKHIDPLYISYHLDNPEDITKDFVRYLKKHEPIGCRDTYTANIFNNLGIKSYFSGCLTLTLGKTYRNKHNYNSKTIYIVDCPVCNRHKQFILNYVENITNHSNYTIVYMNHEHSKSLTHKQRFELADNILRKYESAFLVLTSRLHACLPCVAMNTSVILVRDNLDKRFTGLIDFTNYININRTNTYIKVLHQNGIIINPAIYKNYSSKLDKTVKKFLFYS